ncbi:PQQ-binding-like beta-propeller repeat protein [Phenylobacterium sp. VNQ135]|uniref:outer membrane protein assembly factor BamB family protein n=1 Tax=Phenylobacterium sp. VNQ135 TaxID=3400922 RepID=UPI003C12AFB9
MHCEVRRRTLLALMGGAAAWLAGTAAGAAEVVEWPYYAADPGYTRYSPANLITPRNVKGLKVLWTRPGVDPAFMAKHPDAEAGKYFQATPLMIGGVLYAQNALGLVEAFDAETGRTIWTQEPPSTALSDVAGAAKRGVAFWTDGTQKRIISFRSGWLYSLDAATGKPDPSFGEGGRISLVRLGGGRFSVSGPPTVAKDLVIVGGSGSAPGNADYYRRIAGIPESVRAYDVRTGRRVWEFSPVPAEGDPARATWGGDSARVAGSMGSYGMISYDPELGYAYFAFTAVNPTSDGTWRPGDNLYADTLIAVEAATGRKIWHQQLVRHDLWDYDVAAAPVLGYAQAGGKRIPTVMATGKVPLLFTFDRRTGEPVWKIEERPVPASTVPGEQAAPTQPFPSKPAPLDRVGIGEDDLIDFTPELRREALEIFRKYTPGPIYTPPSPVSATNLGTLTLPGVDGGGNWNTGAFDPETGVYFGATLTAVASYGVEKASVAGEAPYKAVVKYIVDGPRGLPLVKPPYGRITAVDMRTGDFRWVATIGEGPRDHPALKGLKLPRLGIPSRVAVAVTKSLVFAGQSSDAVNLAEIQKGYAPKFNAYDKATGRVLAEVDLPAGSGTTGAPITYVVNGKQIVLVAVGGRNATPQWVAMGL